MAMKHFYTKIHGWCYCQELYEEMVEAAPQNGAKFVEVGAWKGKSAAFMAVTIANSDKDIKFSTVDTWLGSDERAHKKDTDILAGTLYETFLSNIEPVALYINPMRMTSVEASRRFSDGELDFVFIDASHKYIDVCDDINAWLPKINESGTLGGDDIGWSGVKRAVDETIGEGNYQIHGRYWQFKKETGTKGIH
jgi:hypothetical protein